MHVGGVRAAARRHVVQVALANVALHVALVVGPVAAKRTLEALEAQVVHSVGCSKCTQ